VTQVDARKMTLKGKDALTLLHDVDEIYASKGKQVVHLDLRREKPDAATLKALLLGPTGNLRAPTLRRGRTLIVGFDESTYAKLLR
jgi:arsenate reductase-like glutaredoxin family protein